MNYKVQTTPPFEKDAKKLARKYPSLKNDLLQLINSLEINPVQGISLGNNFYDIRLSITSKARGKSGGARVITFVKVIKQTIFLAAIYDKSEQSDISDKELKWLAEIISKNSSSSHAIKKIRKTLSPFCRRFLFENVPYKYLFH